MACNDMKASACLFSFPASWSWRKDVNTLKLVPTHFGFWGIAYSWCAFVWKCFAFVSVRVRVVYSPMYTFDLPCTKSQNWEIIRNTWSQISAVLLLPSEVWHHICHHENPHKVHPAVVRFTTDVTYRQCLWKTIWWGQGLVEVSCKYNKEA